MRNITIPAGEPSNVESKMDSLVKEMCIKCTVDNINMEIEEISAGRASILLI